MDLLVFACAGASRITVDAYLFATFSFVEIVLLYAVCSSVKRTKEENEPAYFGLHMLLNGRVDLASDPSQFLPSTMISLGAKIVLSDIITIP